MCNNENNNCIAEILDVINILQQNANCADSCLDSCDRGVLGCGVNSLNCNTRPVILYTCQGNGVPFTMPTTRVADCDATATSSCVFRVEKLDGNCATFRVLTPNDETAQYPYTTTNSFFTMNLDCLCAIRCLPDTYVECI